LEELLDRQHVTLGGWLWGHGAGKLHFQKKKKKRGKGPALFERCMYNLVVLQFIGGDYKPALLSLNSLHNQNYCLCSVLLNHSHQFTK